MVKNSREWVEKDRVNMENSGGKSKESDWVERLCGCFMCYLVWRGLSK